MDRASVWAPCTTRRRTHCRARAPETAARVLLVVDDRRHAEVLFAAAGEGVGDIGQVDFVGSDNSAARAERECCSASGVLADNNSTCGPGRMSGAGTAGASSTITCALVPPTPSELTAARRAFPLRPGPYCPATWKGVLVNFESAVGLAEIEARGNRPVPQRQHRLDRARDRQLPCRGGRCWS